jgi:hypothetical protein
MDKAEFRANYKQERCIYFARNRSRTIWRVRFLYASALFFGITAVARVADGPLTAWDFSGFVFVAFALLTARWIRSMLTEGEALLAAGAGRDGKKDVIDVTASEVKG